MDKIKPCPFCGHDDPFFDETIIDGKPVYFLSCPDCCAQGPTADEERLAGEWWNQRV